MYFERGEVITRMWRTGKRGTVFVTSDEMTLREFYGAILLFRNENQYIFVFLIKIILKKSFWICDKQIITWDFGHRP